MNGLESASARIDDVLGGLLEPGEPVALVNFADHANVGDAAIWLGQLAVLHRLGHPIRHQCAWWGYDADDLRRRHPDGPVLINGGGNFGDLYPQHDARMAVVADFPDRRVLQLSQSIHFDDAEAAASTAEAWNRHPDLHLLLRESASRRVADGLGLESLACPDMVLALGVLDRPRPAEVPVLWLRRQDGEARPVELPEIPDGVVVHDWLAPVPGELPWPRRARWARRVDRWSRRTGRQPLRILAPVFETLARHWTHRGLDLLSRGSVVVTDRLHGHLLATLLGIPNVATDNRTGKVRAVYEEVSGSSPLTTWAGDPAEALEIARGLAADTPPGPA